MPWNRKTTRKDRKRKSRKARRFLAKVVRDQSEAFGFRRRQEWHVPFDEMKWGGWTYGCMDEQALFVLGPFISIPKPRSIGVISGYSIGASLPVDTPPPAVT